jgi:hypothetical protein
MTVHQTNMQLVFSRAGFLEASLDLRKKEIFSSAGAIQRCAPLGWTCHEETFGYSLNKIFKSDFVDFKRTRRRPNYSWKEAVDRNSIAFGIGNWQAVASDRASFRGHLREAVDHK